MLSISEYLEKLFYPTDTLLISFRVFRNSFDFSLWIILMLFGFNLLEYGFKLILIIMS